MDSIPWDQEVELFQASGRQRDLRVTRTKMPLHKALIAFLDLPEDQQRGAGFGLHEPIRMTVDGRDALIGWYNAEACHVLARFL